MTSINRPPRWVLVLWALPLITVLVLRGTDILGDEGMVNGATYALALLTLGMVGLWFLLASGLSWRARLGLPGVLVLVLVLIAQVVTFEGWYGGLLPILRLGPTPPRVLLEQSGASLGELPPSTSEDWPGFLGPRRDLSSDVAISTDWAEHPPELLWRHDVGDGWSAFALAHGLAITQEQRGEQQAVSAYDLLTGELRWIHTWGGTFADALGGLGPRATPTIAMGRVYALGPGGLLLCLDARDGARLWSQDLRAAYGMTDELEERLINYGRANSPLVDGQRVIVPAGGDPKGRQAGLVAFDAASGELLAEGPPRQVSFASPSRATLCGVDQILIVNEGWVSGHDPQTLAELWSYPWGGRTTANASCSQALALAGDRVLLSKGYGFGATLLQLTRSDQDGAIQVSKRWSSKKALRTKFTNAAIFGGTAVALSDGILECVSLADGKRVWKNGRHGHGQILKVRDHLLVLTEQGELLLIDPSPAGGGEVLARQEVLEGKTWNNLALSGDLLAVRNGREASVWRLPLLEE